MARTPLLQLTDLSLSFGGASLFSDLDLVVQPGDRLALVGRNGCGKSTLLKVMAGLVDPDQGEITTGAGIRVSYMEQEPDLSAFATLGDFAARRLEPGQEYRVDRAAEGLDFDPSTPVSTASGGERRRAALAGLLAEEPDLMLLDEPTNHLDIQAIRWLEGQLRSSRSAFVLISHDRVFLRALSRGILWMDRGVIRRLDQGFDAFEGWRDRVWKEEDLSRHKLDRLIKSEAKWAVEGISARRKRNQGRVRALADLRAERADMIRRQGTAAMAFDAGPASGKKVIEARKISKSFGLTPIVRDFSIQIGRRDRVAIVGPNGVGKTTLIKLLTGQIEPDQGLVRQGAKLEMVLFDQNRTGLAPDLSLWENLVREPEMAISGKPDQVMVRGTPRHVVGYLRDFLFSEDQARAPVRSLSGGEKSRLLLARLMARQSNFLILDEPTNDLDVETLDLLQDVLASYEGTVLLVSHDRDFLDRVATMTIAMEGDGQATVYPGGWSDYQSQRQGRQAKTATPDPKPQPKPKGQSSGGRPQAKGLSFTQKHRLQELPDIIERLESEILKLTDFLAQPDLFTKEPTKFHKASEALAERQKRLDEAEGEWLELEEMSEP